MSGSQPVDASKVRWSEGSSDLLLGASVTYRDAGKEYEGIVQVVGEEELTRRRIYAVEFTEKFGLSSTMRLLTFAEVQALNPQFQAPPASETWADRARAAPASNQKRWEFREARRTLLRYLTKLTLQGLGESEAAPGGYPWPHLGDEGKIPGFFENLNQQLRMFAAPMLDDARASLQQSLQTMPMSSYWKVYMIPRGLSKTDCERLARGLPDSRMDDQCRYFSVDKMEGESRKPKNSWLPFSTVLLVQCEVPHDKKALPSVPHRFGVLHRDHDGAYIVQVSDWGKDACPICASDFHLDRRSAVSCDCGGLKVHSCCARYAERQSPLDAALTCQLCSEMVAEPRTDSADHRTWAMFVMDSVMAPLRQASVLETPKDHLPCFWSKDISGSPFSPELDVNEILPEVTREQHKSLKSVRKGPITSKSEMDDQESSTNRHLKELNSSQREACKEALILDSGVVLVQGPPGTGKTKTIASLILACAANRQRVLTCGPTNVAAMEAAMRTEQMVQSGGGMLRRAEICIVASEDRVGITMEHPLSELMLDHRKKRVKRVAKAGLRDLVPMLRDILERPRKVFQTWRNCALSGEDAHYWATTSAKVAQTKLPTREVMQRHDRGECFPAPDTDSVPPDTDEAFRTFLSTQAFQAIEDILKWQQEHLTSSLPKLRQHVDNLDHEEGAESKKLPEQLQELRRTMERVRDIVRAMRTALQRGQAPEADENQDPWEHMGTASRDLDQAVKDWAVVCHDVSKANSEELRSHILEGAQVIFSTTTVAGRVRVWQQKIPNVILDEACQCRELETMVVMRRHVQCLILVGDPEQLPSTVFSKKAKEIGFDRSLFERLVEIGRSKHTLARQYRMLPQIAEFPNVTFYDSQVVNDDTVKIMDAKIEDYIDAPDQKWNFQTPMRLYDTGNGDYEEIDKANMARSNRHEAELVVKLLHNFFQKNETDHRLSVGIITPYLGQVRLIKELIYSDSATVHAKKLQKKVKLVKTVDGFQGNEQDIIVISTVRSNRKGQIGFVSDRRRLNVAITRARLRLWIIGDLTTLEHDDTWRSLISFCRLRKLVQAVPDDRTEAERKVERVVAEASGSGYGRPSPAAAARASGSSGSRARPSANARVAVPQAYIAAGGDDGTLWNSFFLQQLVTMISRIREETHRRAVVKKITQILAGELSVWKPYAVRDGSNLMLWQKVVEETPTIGNARLIWWVEIDTHGVQVVVLADLVQGDRLVQAKARASNYLHTFSDECLTRCLDRQVEDGRRVLPKHFTESFERRRQQPGGAEVLEPDSSDAQDGLPVSLEKRYVMRRHELEFLVRHTLQHVQLPYSLDNDEEVAYDKAAHEVVFLLGRSGSGKTSVLVHSLFRAACQERQRRSEGGGDDEALLSLLVTRSPVLADSIRKLFAQMQAGPAGGSTESTQALEDLAGIELGVVKEEERRQFRPPPKSLEDDVFDPSESPVITCWDSLLLMLDRSIQGEAFFRQVDPSTSRVTQALQRRNRGAVNVRGEDRFENSVPEQGRFDMARDHLTYEEFEDKCGPKLWKTGGLSASEGDSVFSAYREFLTVIAGSPRAARSRDGCLSKEEYVTGKAPDGSGLPEIKDSAYRKSEQGRERIYTAFEVYRKFKQDTHKYDCTDVARDLLKRAEKFKLKSIRMFFGVYIDEVQDLLPVELLLLKLICERPDGFIFAGDTAQTISKGVEFRFESIRRLFFEEFCGGREVEVEKVNIKVQTCSMCHNEIRNGGKHYICNGKYHEFYVCNQDKCEKEFEKQSEAVRLHGKGTGLQKRLAASSGKIVCFHYMPGTGHCGLMFNIVETVPPLPSQEVQPDLQQNMSGQINQLAQVPAITCLSQNHRSTNSILELAASILDLITHFFPEKLNKLPKETSRVKSSTPPVILNRMSWEEAQKIIFARESSENAVLEFGAKQVVLVWSEEKKREMKQKLTQSLVMTINECKGLEFFDVLLVDPFSDMSGSTKKESQATENWNLIYGVFEKFQLKVSQGEKKRASTFIEDKHGLLCSWLKTLYVGVTRARKRVWILESEDSGQALVGFLKGLGVAQVCHVGDDQAIQGFADTSSAQEWFDEGLRMFRQFGKFESARLCFDNAEKSGLAQGAPWKLLAEAEEYKTPGKEDFGQAGAAYVKLAEWLENALTARENRHLQSAAEEVGLEEKNLRPREARQRAAETFLEIEDFGQAGREFEAAGCFKDAAECAEVQEKWEKAGDLWRKAEEAFLALKSFQRGEIWGKFVEVAQGLGDQKLPTEVMDLIELACRDLAKKCQKQKQQKESNMFKALKQCISLLPQEEEQELLLQQLDWQELTLEVYQTQKRYDQCAAIALEMCDWTKARYYYSQANDVSEAHWLELIEALWKLLHGGVVPAAMEETFQKLFSEDEMKRLAKVEDAKSSSKKEGLKRKHIAQTLRHLHEASKQQNTIEGIAKRGSLLRDAYSAALQLKESCPGYALRLTSFTLMAMAQNFTQLRTKEARHFDLICEGFAKSLAEIKEMRSTWNRRGRSHNYKENKRGGVREKGLSEWLLAEQPASVKPHFLLLTECQPQKGEGRRVNFKELSELATSWSHVFEASLCCHWLELCKVVAENQLRCWSDVVGYKCDRQKSLHELQLMSPRSRKDDPGCTFLHRDGDTNGVQQMEMATSVCRRLLKASISSSQILQGKELKDTLQLYGQMAMDALGGADRWKRLSSMPQQSIDLLMARLKALAPESPTRALDAALNDEEVHELAQEATRTKLDAMTKMNRPPELQEVFSVLETLPFLRPEDREKERYRLLATQSLLHGQVNNNPVKMVIQAENQVNAYQYLRQQWFVLSKLLQYWSSNKERRDKFQSLKPSSVLHVMEKVVVWALVCLTRFDNLYLPHSYIQAHLTGCQGLAKHAATAQKEVAESWKKECRDALGDVAKFIYNLIFWDLYLFEWLKNRKAHSGEVMAQIASLLITIMMANDQQVRSKVIEHWRYIKPEKKLDIMTTIENNEGNALPGSVLRLLICLPNDEKTLLPCASEAMQKLRNPVVCLWRQGWSREDRRLLRKGRLWLKRLPRGLEEVIKRKVKREDVKNALVKPDVVAWPKMRNIQVDAADPADERWNPAAVLRSWISVRNEATEAAEAAEVDAGAEEVAEEQEQPEEEQETGAEAEPEQGLQLAAPDAAVASAGPSGVVEGTKLSEEEIVKIVEAKRKKTTLRTIWSTWQDVVNEAHREVSVEEREHLEALRVLGDLEELQSEHKIRYRAFVVPMRRRHAEEEGRLKDLQKILKQIDPEKLQQKSLEKAKGNKAGDKGGNAAMAEIISKAQTTVQKLLKFSEDFQKNEITPNFLMEEAEATVRKILMSRRLLMGVKLATAKTKKDAPVFSPSETCLPSLLRRLELESYLYPTWICEQLKRRLARLRGEAVNFQGAPILWGPRRRWDSRARTFSIEEAVKLCKDMNVAAPMPVTQKTPEDLVDTVEDSQDTVEATEAETPDAANLAQGNAETARRVEAEEQPGETGQPEDAEPEDQPEDQTEAEPSEALEASKDTKVAWELEDEATVEEENSARPFTLGEEDDMQEQNATVGQEVDEESEEAIEQPELKEGDEQINGKVSSPGAQPLEPSEQRMEDAAHEETKDAEKAEQEEAALNSALEEEGAEAEDNHEGHQDAIEESKEEQGEQDAPECAKEETTEPEDIDSAGQGELAESPPDEKDSKEEIAEEDALEAPEIADEHFGSLDMTSPPEQKETPAADAEGENASLCIGEARGETPEDQPVSQADAQAELEERQRKKAAKFEKKRQQKKETQEDLAVEEEPDPGLLAQWCEDEKELRDKAVKLCMQLCKSLAELMNSNSNTNKQGQKEEKAGQKAPPSRRFLQQLKEKVDSKVAEWQEFCNCPASDVFIKNQALWTQKRRKRFGELMDCQDDLEWAKPNSKADEKISLLQRGITSPERGAWALHYGAEIIMSQSYDLTEVLDEYIECDLADDEPEPKLEKRDRDAAISILKMMSHVWKLVDQAAKAQQGGEAEAAEIEAAEEEQAEAVEEAASEVPETGEGDEGSADGTEKLLEMAPPGLATMMSMTPRQHLEVLAKNENLEEARNEILGVLGIIGSCNEATLTFRHGEALREEDLLGPDPEQLCQTVSAAQSIEELRSSQGYHSAMSLLKALVKTLPDKKGKSKIEKEAPSTAEESSSSRSPPSKRHKTEVKADLEASSKEPPATEESAAASEVPAAEAEEERKSNVSFCPDCKEQMEKRKVRKHKLKDCPMRSVECPDCQGRMRWKNLEEHRKSECDGRPVQCEVCKGTTTYGKRQVHKDHECPEREVLCPNAADDKIRCVWTGPAKDLEKHMEQCKSKAEFQEMTARFAASAAPKSPAAPKPKQLAPTPVVPPKAKAAPPPAKTENAWPLQQEEEAKAFAARWGLEWCLVKVKLEGLSPPQRELIMERFQCPPGHVPGGKFVKYVDSCVENGWKYVQSYSEWLADIEEKLRAKALAEARAAETKAKAAAKVAPARPEASVTPSKSFKAALAAPTAPGPAPALPREAPLVEKWESLAEAERSEVSKKPPPPGPPGPSWLSGPGPTPVPKEVSLKKAPPPRPPGPPGPPGPGPTPVPQAALRKAPPPTADAKKAPELAPPVAKKAPPLPPDVAATKAPSMPSMPPETPARKAPPAMLGPDLSAAVVQREVPAPAKKAPPMPPRDTDDAAAGGTEAAQPAPSQTPSKAAPATKHMIFRRDEPSTTTTATVNAPPAPQAQHPSYKAPPVFHREDAEPKAIQLKAPPAQEPPARKAPPGVPGSVQAINAPARQEPLMKAPPASGTTFSAQAPKKAPPVLPRAEEAEILPVPSQPPPGPDELQANRPSPSLEVGSAQESRAPAPEAPAAPAAPRTRWNRTK